MLSKVLNEKPEKKNMAMTVLIASEMLYKNIRDLVNRVIAKLIPQ